MGCAFRSQRIIVYIRGVVLLHLVATVCSKYEIMIILITFAFLNFRQTCEGLPLHYVLLMLKQLELWMLLLILNWPCAPTMMVRSHRQNFLPQVNRASGALTSISFEHKISKSRLKRLVKARINDAKREVIDIPETIKKLERYAEDTASTLLYTIVQASGITSTATDYAASQIGKASGLLVLLRSLSYHASRNGHFSYIPAQVAEKHGLLVNQGGRREIQIDSREGIYNAVFEIASVANVHLLKARGLYGIVPAEARPGPVLLPAVPAEAILDSLSRVQFDAFDPMLNRGIFGTPPLWF